MWETLYSASGCGLAAPQVGKSIRLFIVDTKIIYDHTDPEDREEFFVPGDTGLVETFINARIIERFGEPYEEEEGCLSIPNMAQRVKRPWSVTIEYQDKDFVKHTKTFEGTTARTVQHEYDHTDGILYIDRISPLTRKLIDGKLKKIAIGKFPAKYPMIYKKR
jgi:peptide deformylase